MRLPRGRLSLPPLTVEARLRDVNRPVVPPPGRPARAFRASTAAATAMAMARFFVRIGHINGGKKDTHATTTVLFPGHFRASLSVYPEV